ncbi:hypothetical protein [Shimazuella kribbensis]|uniref:hypothetical protein n=1 Tax=Shimazuella kribbensis TaxID=139808 RepID=UPI000422502C|nr:hypothetical protein [Shimazuella kribbensis]
MKRAEWKNFGKLILFVCAFSIGQLIVWKLLSPIQIVFTINGFAIDLTTFLHLVESVLVYSVVLYLFLKKFGYWEKIFGDSKTDIIQKDEPLK